MNPLISEKAGETFEQAAPRAVKALCDALRQAIRSLYGKQVDRPHELAKALGLDKALAWKVSQMIYASDVLEAGRYLPGALAMDILYAALVAAGAPKEAVRAVEAAFDDVETVIRVHAGDRATYDAMWAGLGAHGPYADAQMELEHRRAAFRGNSFNWGVQAKARTLAYFLLPGSTPEVFDIISLHGFVALRGLRPQVPWVVSRSSFTENTGEHRPASGRQPLDENTPPDTVPLLQKYCSKPLPEFRRIAREGGIIDDEVIVSRSGNTGVKSLFMGERIQNVKKPTRESTNHNFDACAALWTPCEIIVIDLIVHESLFGPLLPTFRIFSELGAAAPFPADRAGRHILPCSDRVAYMGKGIAALRSRVIADYPEMAADVIFRTGWEQSKFDVYRVEVRYPPIPSTMVMEFEIPH